MTDSVIKFVGTGGRKRRDDDVLIVDGAFELVTTAELEPKDDGGL